MSRLWTTSDAGLQLELPAAGGRRAALEVSLRAAILDGRLTVGARLPSTRVLAEDLGLARGTVVEAYAQLAAEGYVDARRGSGTRVAAGRAEVPPVAAPESVTKPRYSFHPGLPDLTAFPRQAWTAALRRALATVPASSLGYGDYRGRAELRTALLGYLARARGVASAPERVIVCSGFQHGLSQVLRAARGQGARRIAIEDPCLPRHRQIASALGLEIADLPVDEYGARTDLLEDLGVDIALLAPAHQFPLGCVLAADRRAGAVAWARATGGLLVEDDYDAELRYDRQPIGALQALAPELVAYGGTTSKTLAPGLRLGWFVVPDRFLEPIREQRQMEDLHVPVLEQLALAELVESGTYERHLRRMRGRYRRRRAALVRMLSERAPAIVPVGISAGLRVLLILPPWAPSGAEVVELARGRSLELIVLPPLHGAATPGPEGIVIGYGALPEHEYDRGIEALGAFLADVCEPTRDA